MEAYPVIQRRCWSSSKLDGNLGTKREAFDRMDADASIVFIVHEWCIV